MYTAIKTSCVFAAQTEIVRDNTQPMTATETDTTNKPTIAPKSTPPSKVTKAATGTPQAISPEIGASRAPNLPSTISASERSVTIMCASVPRARSMQIDPAVDAGAAKMTSET